MRQFTQAQSYRNDLEVDENDIEKLQDSRTRALDTNVKNVECVSTFQRDHSKMIKQINSYVNDVDNTTRTFTTKVRIL